MDYESRERRVIVWDKPHKDFRKKHKQPVGVGLMASLKESVGARDSRRRLKGTTD
jgi:hypothetical protein